MLIRCLTIILLLFPVIAVAQTYLPVTVTGFNSDLFAETAPNSLSTTSMSTDLSNHVMYTTAFAAGAGLPAGVVNTGTVVSGTRTYQMAPFNGQNALYVDVGTTQSFTLFTTGTYSKISLMGFSSEGNSTLNVKLNFTDGTTSNYGNHTLADWFNGANAVYCCFSRCIRTAAAPYNIDGLPSNPRFYPLDISLSCSDQKKNLQSVIIENLNGTTGFTNAFLLAVSGVAYSESIFSFTNPVTCPGGNNGSIFLFASGTASPFTYSWNTIPVQTTANATNLTAGTYVCTITDVNGCVTYDTITVDGLIPQPVDAQALPQVICAGDTSQLLVSGLTNFNWQPGGQTNSPAPVNPAVTTTYTVSGTDASGCLRQDTVTLVVNSLPVISVSPDPVTVCTADSIQLLASGASTYSWVPATGLSNASVPDPKASPASTTVYTVTGTATNNCSASYMITVTVEASPSITAGASPATICEGDTASLFVSGLASFTWSPGGQTVSPLNVSPAVTSTYTVSGVGTNGCAGEATVLITVNQLPQITASPTSVTICPGDSVQLMANGGSTYTWSPVAGLNNTLISNPVAFPAVSTIYTVTGANAAGCSNSATVLITVHPPVTVSISMSPAAICQSDSVELTVTGLSQFEWLPGGQTFSPFITAPGTTTTYTVTGSDQYGCFGMATAEVTVDPVPVVIAAASDSVVCSGTVVILSASGNAGQYAWAPGNGSGSTYQVTPADTVAYVLTGILGNCISTDTIQINVIPAPTITFTATPEIGCDPLLVDFTGTGSSGVSWNWSFGDGTSASGSGPSHVFHEGVWDVVVTASDASGCTTALSQPDLVTVYAVPVADFSANPPLNTPTELDQAAFQFFNHSTGAISYAWNFGDGSTSTEEDPLHSYKTEGQYRVSLSAEGPAGCIDTIAKEFIPVIPATTGFIPNAFTPNGDGVNDVFIPANSNLVSFDMKIFNRWGKQVFSSSGQLSGWDGDDAGKPAEIGVYIYSVSLLFENGDLEIHKGNLTLIR